MENKTFVSVLLKVQKELPIVGKNTSSGSGSFSYKYATLDKVWDKCGKIINENGFVITHEITETGIKTTARHELGELTSFFKFTAEAVKPQKLGSEATYARRYNLTAIFNIIIAGEDDDAQEAMATTKAKKTEKSAYKNGAYSPEGDPLKIID
jgi:hypothetical protein